MISIDNKAFLEPEDLAYKSRTVKEPVIWDFADDLSSYDFVFYKNGLGLLRVIKGHPASGPKIDKWAKSIDELETIIGISITWPSIWISFEARSNTFGPHKHASSSHECIFVDPGIGKSEWCKHDGCTFERPRFVRHK